MSEPRKTLTLPKARDVDPPAQQYSPADEMYISCPTLGTWRVKYRRIGQGWQEQRFSEPELVADFVRKLLLPRG